MENREEANIGDKINDFIQRNRKAIFTIAGLIIVLFIGTIVFFAVEDVLRKNAIVELEELNSRYDDLRFFTADENYSGDIEKLLADLNSFAQKKSGFSGSRAWDLIARIHSSREQWQQAENAFYNAAVKGNKTYLAPLAYANAAVAAEEQGNLTLAVEYLQKALDHPFEFPGAARAQFNIGRLYEAQGKTADAIEAYRLVLVKWSTIPIWHELARSAIIALEVR